MILRVVMYASSAARPAPTQAVSTPSSSVLRMALWVELERNVNDQFANVKFSQVSGWAQAREKAALARIPYGRNTAQARTARQPRSAGYRQGPSGIGRRCAPLPPTDA